MMSDVLESLVNFMDMNKLESLSTSRFVGDKIVYVTIENSKEGKLENETE